MRTDTNYHLTSAYIIFWGKLPKVIMHSQSLPSYYTAKKTCNKKPIGSEGSCHSVQMSDGRRKVGGLNPFFGR